MKKRETYSWKNRYPVEFALIDGDVFVFYTDLRTIPPYVHDSKGFLVPNNSKDRWQFKHIRLSCDSTDDLKDKFGAANVYAATVDLGAHRGKVRGRAATPLVRVSSIIALPDKRRLPNEDRYRDLAPFLETSAQKIKAAAHKYLEPQRAEERKAAAPKAESKAVAPPPTPILLPTAEQIRLKRLEKKTAGLEGRVADLCKTIHEITNRKPWYQRLFAN
jgi:hypothetical protein